MLPWVTLDRAEVPGEREPLVLLQRGHEFVIRVGPTALMGSEQHGSEEALAEFACAREDKLARKPVEDRGPRR